MGDYKKTVDSGNNEVWVRVDPNIDKTKLGFIDDPVTKEGLSDEDIRAIKYGFQDHKDYVRCRAQAQFKDEFVVADEGIVDPSIDQERIGIIDDIEYNRYANKGVSDKFKLGRGEEK